MKLLANESFPHASVLKLRHTGLDIIAIGEAFSSISEEEVMLFAIALERVILTFDRNYGELIFKHGYKPMAGVIYFRIESFTADSIFILVIELLNDVNLKIAGNFTVIDEENIRHRKII